jgi:hypothetical protein
MPQLSIVGLLVSRLEGRDPDFKMRRAVLRLESSSLHPPHRDQRVAANINFCRLRILVPGC